MVALKWESDEAISATASLYTQQELAARDAALSEVAIYQAHVARMCRSQEQRSLEEATNFLRNHFDRLYTERAAEIVAESDNQFQELAQRMQESCRLELMQAESRSERSNAENSARLAAYEAALAAAQTSASAEVHKGEMLLGLLPV